MNANRIFDMMLRQVMRRLIGRGVNAGIDRMTRGGGQNDGEADGAGGKGRRASPGGARKHARTTKQAMRLARRIGRF
ncbi:hypothetical protein DRV85_13785 [Rhodosalinus halophilus]|uniref:Uncharacterized protein n=1 Tax=Rhodosalinus halophilus TaxID=2259333 RepID=A0A365U829_9RHOB|nr:hypothetical protein [Rhodosalinus halophilus]RBI84073.1 hypothetical protein DRV85_13785 [Rhodosalinus halophilus]